METENKPRYLLAAEELARQRGTDAQEILRRNREAVRSSGYPGPDCLVPEEVESFFTEPAGMEAGRVEHARNCSGCSALLAGAGVDQAEIERLLVQVRTRHLRPAVDWKEAASRPEGVESHFGRRVKWVAALGSVLALALLRFSRRSSHAAHTAPEPQESMAVPIAAKEM
jgi:hypothetical protein